MKSFRVVHPIVRDGVIASSGSEDHSLGGDKVDAILPLLLAPGGAHLILARTARLMMPLGNGISSSFWKCERGDLLLDS